MGTSVTGEWQHGRYVISTAVEKLDLDVVNGYLTTAYWSRGISRSLVEQAVRNSLPFGVYCDDHQVGFARVVTDRSTFAWLADVFILPSKRGIALGKWLMAVVMGHPDLQGLRRWILATQDAHALYRQFGFSNLVQQEQYMQITELGMYLHAQDSHCC